MLAIPPFWASSKKALLRANTKPPVELVVADFEQAEDFYAHRRILCEKEVVYGKIRLLYERISAE